VEADLVTARSTSLLATRRGTLLVVYALVRAPEQGWSTARTIGELVEKAIKEIR
jgi:hypothetical protein